MDTVGFTVRYFNQLLSVGSPDAEIGTRLVGHDSHGPIECELDFDKDEHALYKFGRPIERGTPLSYKSTSKIPKILLKPRISTIALGFMLR
ncbi:MAG: hypothetical protein WDN75_04240 [Bacteroidota bacterium]